MTSSLTTEAIAEYQVARRTENERIESTSDSLGLHSIPFVCECALPSCSEIVRLTFDQYEAIRQHPRLFFTRPGHEATAISAGAERVVAMMGDVTVVEKIGLAGEIAAAAQPRDLP